MSAGRDGRGAETEAPPADESWSFTARQRPLPLPIVEQMALDLPVPTPKRPIPPVETMANRNALLLLGAPELWSGGAICLLGAKGSGKSLILSWRFPEAPRLSARDFAGSPLRGDLVAPGRTLLFEDVDRALAVTSAEARGRLEAALFHLLNMIAQRGARLILSARTPPTRWMVDLPDLRSRLAALSLARIGPPDDAHLAAALRDGFARRGVLVDARTLEFLTTHLDRSFDAVERIVDRVDALAAREGAPVDRRLAARALRWSAPKKNSAPKGNKG